MKRRLSFAERFRRLRRLIVREPLPPESIAAGWALGMFIGCAVPFGLQLVIAIPLSAMMRVSKLGATLGTFITNPVTIIFIYPAQCWVGSRLLRSPFTWEYLRGVCAKLTEISLFAPDTWGVLAQLGGKVLCSFFFGGFVNAAVLSPITYFVIKGLVVSHRRRKAVRLERRRAQLVADGAAAPAEGASK